MFQNVVFRSVYVKKKRFQCVTFVCVHENSFDVYRSIIDVLCTVQFRET